MTNRICSAIIIGARKRIWCHSQVVRPRSAKPLFPSSNLGGTSKTKSTPFGVLFVLETMCSACAERDAHFVRVAMLRIVMHASRVSGGTHCITLRRRRKTSLCQRHNITSAKPMLHLFALGLRYYISYVRWMVPQAILVPAFPAGCDVKSSGILWMTTVFPRISETLKRSVAKV